MKELYLSSNIRVIKKGMVDSDIDYLFIPTSIKRIEDNAINIKELKWETVNYLGTVEQWKSVKIGKNNSLLNINCTNGVAVEGI